MNIERLVDQFFQHDDYASLPLDDRVVVYVDGSSIDNGKPHARAGFGVFFANPDLPSIHSHAVVGPKQTNNVAELSAILFALRMTKRDMEIVTDSEVSIKTINNGRRPGANGELVYAIRNAMRDRLVRFRHVRAHTGAQDLDSIGNSIVDLLARAGTTRP